MSIIFTCRYQRLKIPEDEEIEGESSAEREERAKQRPPPDCKSALLELLSDTLCDKNPFFREYNHDKVFTVTLGECLEYIHLYNLLDRICPK